MQRRTLLFSLVATLILTSALAVAVLQVSRGMDAELTRPALSHNGRSDMDREQRLSETAAASTVQADRYRCLLMLVLAFTVPVSILVLITIQRLAGAYRNLRAQELRDPGISYMPANSSPQTADPRTGNVLKQLRETLDYLRRLRRFSEQIRNDRKALEELAFHTSILALNAGVEATRPGDTGKDFEQLAEDFRLLSKQCTETAAQMAGLSEDSIAAAVRGNNRLEEGVAACSNLNNDDKLAKWDFLTSHYAATAEQNPSPHAFFVCQRNGIRNAQGGLGWLTGKIRQGFRVKNRVSRQQ